MGVFDVVASRYGVRVQGADELALTKLDVLSYLDKIPVCVAYEIDGERTGEFPSGRRLNQAKPVYEYLDGWHRDISGCRSIDALPAAAQRYIDYLQKAVDCPIRTISVGADREAYFTR